MKTRFRNNWPTVVGLLLLLLITLINFRNVTCISILNDEFGYWGNAATMAGMDWSGLLARTPFYSMGYSLILAPLFKLGLPNEWMYRISVLLNVAFIIVSYFCALYAAKKLFPKLRSSLRQLICVVSVMSCAVLCYSQIAWSEVFITTLMWCLVALFVRLEDRWSYFASLAIVLVVMLIYLAHQRAILLLPFVALLLLVECIQKKKLLFAGGLVALLVLCMMGYRQLHSWQLDSVYGNSAGVSLNNVEVSSSFVGGYLGRIISNLGLISVSFLCKVGVLMLSTCFTFYLACRSTAIRFTEKDFTFWKTKALVLVSGMMMVALSSMQMFDTSRKDLVVYSRYMDFVFPQAMMLGLLELMEADEKGVRAFLLSTVLSIPLLVLSMYRIHYSDNPFNVATSPLWGALIKRFERFGEAKFMLAGGVMIEAGLLICVLFIFLYRRRFARWRYIFIAALLVLNVVAFQNANQRINAHREQMDSVLSDTIELLQENPDSEIYCVLPEYEENLYADFRMKELQSILYDRPIRVFDTTAEMPEDAIVLSEITLADKELRRRCEPISTKAQIKAYRYHASIVEGENGSAVSQ